MVVWVGTIKKAKCWRIDAFWTVVLEKTLESLWIARRSNKSIPREINPEYWLEGSMLKLKLQYFGHLMWKACKAPWCCERLKAEGGGRGWDGWMASLIQWIWTWANSRRWWGIGRPDVLQITESQSQMWLNDWTAIKATIFPALGTFPMSQLFTSGGQSIGASTSALVLPVNTQDWFPFGWTGWVSLESKGLSRVFSNTTVQKHQFFGTQLSL